MSLLEAPSGSGFTVFGEFDNMLQAQEEMKAYYRKWPSMGYGTQLRADIKGGKIEVRGKREASCD